MARRRSFRRSNAHEVRIGKCQHCAIGRTLVCTDGPVYTYKQIKTLGEVI